MAAVWTQQRRRGHRKFWRLDGVQVKIFRLGFKDRGASCYIVDHSSDGHDGVMVPVLLGSMVATGMTMSSRPALLCFSYFNEFAKSLI
jgi:hypothetical protein